MIDSTHPLIDQPNVALAHMPVFFFKKSVDSTKHIHIHIYYVHILLLCIVILYRIKKMAFRDDDR